MSVRRFKLIWDGMTYKVSEPGVDSCEVVLAHEYDARVAELEQAETERIEWCLSQTRPE